MNDHDLQICQNFLLYSISQYVIQRLLMVMYLVWVLNSLILLVNHYSILVGVSEDTEVEAALKSFNRYNDIMQNYVDPKVMSELFLEHGLITKEQLPGGEVLLQAQMNYMLGNIRKNIGLKNVKVFHSLLNCFKAVPEYNSLARHLEGQSCMYVYNYMELMKAIKVSISIATNITLASLSVVASFSYTVVGLYLE